MSSFGRADSARNGIRLQLFHTLHVGPDLDRQHLHVLFCFSSDFWNSIILDPMLEILFLEAKICVALLPQTLFRLSKEIFYEKKVRKMMVMPG